MKRKQPDFKKWKSYNVANRKMQDKLRKIRAKYLTEGESKYYDSRLKNKV